MVPPRGFAAPAAAGRRESAGTTRCRGGRCGGRTAWSLLFFLFAPGRAGKESAFRRRFRRQRTSFECCREVRGLSSRGGVLLQGGPAKAVRSVRQHHGASSVWVCPLGPTHGGRPLFRPLPEQRCQRKGYRIEGKVRRCVTVFRRTLRQENVTQKSEPGRGGSRKNAVKRKMVHRSGVVV